MFSVIGTGIFLAADGLTKVASISQIEESVGKASLSISNGDASFLSVKVVYSEMAQYISTSDEYFVLQSPATLRDLLNNIVARHSSLTTMIVNMLILINGTPAKLSAPLKDGDEVDFIPVVVGG